MDWRSSKLSDLLEKVIDNRGKTPPLANGGIELIETTSLTGGGKFPDYSLVRKHVSKETFNTWFRAGHPRKGDILVATVGANIGSAAMMMEARGCVAQNLVGLRADATRASPDFLYSYLTWNRTRDELKRMDIGSAQPSLKVPHLLNVEIPLPPLPEQRRIAGILSAYDELMENSQRRIRILETMARSLYREWFVHFRFPGHEAVPRVPSPLGPIPLGWEICSLGDVVQLKSGFAFKSDTFTADGEHRLVTIKNVQDGAFNPESDSRMCELPAKLPSYCVLHDGDILLSLTGNVGRVCLVYDGPFLLNQRVSKLVPVAAYDWAMTYCMFREPVMRVKLEQLSNGVAQQNLSPVLASKMEFVRSPQELRQRFATLAEPMLRRIIQHHSTIQNLRQTRDLLLPRLLTGDCTLK